MYLSTEAIKCYQTSSEIYTDMVSSVYIYTLHTFFGAVVGGCGLAFVKQAFLQFTCINNNYCACPRFAYSFSGSVQPGCKVPYDNRRNLRK